MVMKGERVELECEVSEEGANVKWLDFLAGHRRSASISVSPFFINPKSKPKKVTSRKTEIIYIIKGEKCHDLLCKKLHAER